MKNNNLLTNEINSLPESYHDALGRELISLAAALRLHGFSIIRADDAKPTVKPQDDLWTELSHPSIWIQSRKAGQLIAELRKIQPGTPEHTALNNELISSNLKVQQKLLELLKEFYDKTTPITFYSRLLIETIDQGESNLRSQGASVRLLMDSPTQQQWLRDSQAEMLDFALFLCDRLE